MQDIASLKLDAATSVCMFSRNGWLNNCLEELASQGHIKQLPTIQSPAVVLDSRGLGAFIGDIKTFLERLAREPRLLPDSVLEQADEAELSRTIRLAPASLEAALSSLAAAKSRDEEAESFETLVCHLCVSASVGRACHGKQLDPHFRPKPVTANPSLERTSTGLALGSRTVQCHHPLRGPSVNPSGSAQHKR